MHLLHVPYQSLRLRREIAIAEGDFIAISLVSVKVLNRYGGNMFTASQYVKAASLEEAFTLNQKRNNRIIGGMQWLKMSDGMVGTAIDLSGLGLDQICENTDSWEIGAMVTLRQIEQCASLEQYTNGAVKEALRHIVGVQFRNMATIGGTIAGKYGFSDPITLLSVMACEVCLYVGNGESVTLPIRDYLTRPIGNDIVTGIIIHKVPAKYAYQTVRATETDLPTLTCAVSTCSRGWITAIGARPQIAAVFEKSAADIEALMKQSGAESEEGKHRSAANAFAKEAAEAIPTDSNMRGSAAYRKKLLETLVRRSLESLV